MVAAVWVGVLLVLSVTVWQASGPAPRAEDTYLGLTATIYHVVGLSAGAVLMLVSTFRPDRWLARRRRSAGSQANGQALS